MNSFTEHFKIFVFALIMTLFTLATEDKPNIVIMVADDLGIGDLGCFGNSSLKTPNIDQLSKDGAKLTHHLAAASVCTPSRAALLTGRYPVRSGMVGTGVLRVFLFTAASSGLPQNETTIAEIAKVQGYQTAFIGKWHLGLSKSALKDFHFHPKHQGFDYFYGFPTNNLRDFGDGNESVFLRYSPLLNYYLFITAFFGCITFWLCYCYGLLTSRVVTAILILITILLSSLIYLFISNMKIFNSILMRNFQVVEQPMQLQTVMQRLVLESIEFLEKVKTTRNPFFLFVSWNHVHTALIPSKWFRGKSTHGIYGDSVEELDWSVGEILNALDRLDLQNNTLVYFTSDNGGHLEEVNMFGQHLGGFNGIYRGGKTHGAAEGGIRVPALIKWPMKIPQEKIISEPTSQMDILPTVAKILGVALPNDRVYDGKDVMGLLTGESSISPHEFLFHYCDDEVHAIRYRPRDGTKIWKLHLKQPNYLPGQEKCTFVCQCKAAIQLQPPVLYDIQDDPSESLPLDINRNHKYSQIFSQMMEALAEHTTSLSPVPNQFAFVKLLWRPWLQPCCNFPYCSCQDPKYRQLLDTK